MTPIELQIWSVAFASFSIPDRPARDAARFAAAKVREFRALKPNELPQEDGVLFLQARGGR